MEKLWSAMTNEILIFAVTLLVAWSLRRCGRPLQGVQQAIEGSPSIAPQLKRSHPVTMLTIAECSAQVRQWATTVLADDPAIQRTQYMPGVGHHMWNGLDDNNERAATAISAFLQYTPAPLPNYPTLADIPAFLRGL